MTPPSRNAAALIRIEGESAFQAIEHEASAQVHELYREHSPTLVRQLTRATGCREDARDLVQETFIRLMKLDPGMLARIERPEAFMRRVSTNLLHDWGRSRSLDAKSKAVLEQDSQKSVDQVKYLESREKLRRIEAAMASLNPKTRRIFIAHRVEGMSYAEIAKETGLSIKGVEKQMSKAIAKLHRMLNRD